MKSREWIIFIDGGEVGSERATSAINAARRYVAQERPRVGSEVDVRLGDAQDEGEMDSLFSSGAFVVGWDLVSNAREGRKAPERRR